MPFVNCCQFMYLVISLLVLRAGCGIWVYQFLIIAYLFTLPQMRSFVCKHFHPNWFRVVFQFCDGHMRNVFIDEQHDPATMDISVFSIYTIWANFREEFWSCNRTVDFGFLDSYNMWLIKVKESQQFQFFASYAIDIHANEFQPTNKAACTYLSSLLL